MKLTQLAGATAYRMHVPRWAHAPTSEDFHCDWRELWFNQRVEPPSWVIGDEVIAAGGKGILFPSALRAGGVNLVLYPAMLGVADSLAVFDPGNALPKTQASWD